MMRPNNPGDIDFIRMLYFICYDVNKGKFPYSNKIIIDRESFGIN